MRNLHDDEAGHVWPVCLEEMGERTESSRGASKTCGVTGWRVGRCRASPALTSAIRRVHDSLIAGAPASLQEAVAAVPGSDLFSGPIAGRPGVRFHFALRREKLERVAERLLRLRPRRPA